MVMNTELDTPPNTMGDIEQSLTACFDDIIALQLEIMAGSLTESLQNKCEELQSKYRRNDICGGTRGPR